MKKFYYPPLVLALLSMAICSCGDEAVKEPEIDNENEANIMLESLNLTAQESVVNESYNDFATAVFSEVLKADHSGDNFAISPISTIMTLSMLANSTDEQTAQQIMEMIGIEDLGCANSLCSKLLEALNYESELWNGEVRAKSVLENAVWYDNSLNVISQYLTLMDDVFDSDAYQVDFTTDLVRKVNEWCADKTDNNIPTLLSSPMESKVAWLNVLYYVGKWQSPFDVADTKVETFYGVSGNNSVQMMHQTAIFSYNETANFQAVSLPIGVAEEMVLVLPKEGQSISNIASECVNALYSGNSAKVKLTLPKFKVDYRKDQSYFLEALGMPLCYSSLPAMGVYQDGLIKIIQRTVTEVNEAGAKVAAATIVGYTTDNGSSHNYQEVTMNLNRPFVYFVRNRVSNSILILGCVNSL